MKAHTKSRNGSSKTQTQKAKVQLLDSEALSSQEVIDSIRKIQAKNDGVPRGKWLGVAEFLMQELEIHNPSGYLRIKGSRGKPGAPVTLRRSVEWYRASTLSSDGFSHGDGYDMWLGMVAGSIEPDPDDFTAEELMELVGKPTRDGLEAHLKANPGKTVEDVMADAIRAWCVARGFGKAA